MSNRRPPGSQRLQRDHRSLISQNLSLPINLSNLPAVLTGAGCDASLPLLSPLNVLVTLPASPRGTRTMARPELPEDT